MAFEFSDATWQDAAAIESWWNTPSQKDWHRPYSAELVASLRSPIHDSLPGNKQALKLRNVLEDHEANGTGTLTYGAPDTTTAVLMQESGLSTIYVSGATVSFTDVPGTGEVGADQADYPYTTIPAKVSQLFKAQFLHSRVDQTRLRNGALKAEEIKDRLVPLVADGDSGHGSPTATMKMMKLFAEAGTAAVHIDDLLSGVKDYTRSYNHVLVPVSEHIRRMLAAKLQLDICGSELLLIQRTDAEMSSHITSTIDPRDRPFILGSTNPFLPSFITAMHAGQSEADWNAAAKLMTLDEAVAANTTKEQFDEFLKATEGMNTSDAVRYVYAQKLDVFWSDAAARTVEGWYRYKMGQEAAVSRCVHLAPYADILWSCTPGLFMDHAKEVSEGIKKVFPHKLQAYNHTGAPGTIKGKPDATDAEIKAIQSDLGKLGYQWQFMPLGGQIGHAVAAQPYAKAIVADGLLGYVEGVNRAANVKEVNVGMWPYHMGALTDKCFQAIKIV